MLFLGCEVFGCLRKQLELKNRWNINLRTGNKTRQRAPSLHLKVSTFVFFSTSCSSSYIGTAWLGLQMVPFIALGHVHKILSYLDHLSERWNRFSGSIIYIIYLYYNNYTNIQARPQNVVEPPSLFPTSSSTYPTHSLVLKPS